MKTINPTRKSVTIFKDSISKTARFKIFRKIFSTITTGEDMLKTKDKGFVVSFLGLGGTDGIIKTNTMKDMP